MSIVELCLVLAVAILAYAVAVMNRIAWVAFAVVMLGFVLQLAGVRLLE